VVAESTPPDAAPVDNVRLISIVLPVHDQADHIEDVVMNCEKALSYVDCQHELILVSNGCRDQSPAICQRLGQTVKGIRAIDSVEGGWGKAVRIGLRAAKGTVVGYTNSARTTPEQLTTLVLQALLNPDSVVKAKRVGRMGPRKVGSSLYNWESRLFFQTVSSDINGTPKFFPRRFSRLFELLSDGDLIDLEFMKLCRDEGYPVLEVPIFWGKRHGGASTTRLGTALKLYAGAYRLWRGKNE
jgi:glycosyltransferase involved in cell wall biosynthesis